jgi:hydroxymethylglutaryl-CoA reductase
MEVIQGFSKLNKDQKIVWLADAYPHLKSEIIGLEKYWNQNPQEQKIFDEFSENTLSNYYIPFGVAPNFIINGKNLTVPMVIEESSVVAAAAKSAKFWQNRGGFHYAVQAVEKIGNIHFFFSGDHQQLDNFIQSIKSELLSSMDEFSANMKKRGGGILDLELLNLNHELKDYYKLQMKFDTCDAMGANFINTILEEVARLLVAKAKTSNLLDVKTIDVNMCILSNYTPNCVVKAWVECPIDELGLFDDQMSAQSFVKRFEQAIQIAQTDTYRAVTHNKGIMNGIDAVVLATGNDFRAIEACIHAYAARNGKYSSLSEVSLHDGHFKFSLTIPLAVGTVGGLTSLHPISKLSLALLEQPNAKDLMGIIACVGLAQNFAAVKSLVTTGIQKGHMKMHLLNILKQMQANENEIIQAKEYFQDKVVSYTAVNKYLNSIRLH